MREIEDRNDVTRRNLRALLLALIVLVTILIGLSSCGDGDLALPGEFPPTPTAEATETPEDDEEDV